MVATYLSALDQALETVQRDAQPKEQYPEPPPRGAARQAKTCVPFERLQALNSDLTRIPGRLHDPQEARNACATSGGSPARSIDERTIDWAAAEDLALGSILEDGIAIRLTGEDVERGTFSHRHAVFHDSVTGDRDVPLQRFGSARAAFEIYNSPLTECATIGFEVGYNMQAPSRLVIWEAQ